jgi:t-SNARE complex subunit (syntaxin)
MQAAKNALADIQDKHKDIMRLEESYDRMVLVNPVGT